MSAYVIYVEALIFWGQTGNVLFATGLTRFTVPLAFTFQQSRNLSWNSTVNFPFPVDIAKNVSLWTIQNGKQDFQKIP